MSDTRTKSPLSGAHFDQKLASGHLRGDRQARVVDHAEVGKLIRSAIPMLGFAVDDLEKGLWTPDEWQHLADGLDKLVAALRSGNSERTVVDTEHARGNR